MMDGYSVTEAASVLGVPTERVWELLARGVLAGRPEGETGMRVFLQPRPSATPPSPVDEPAPGPGNGSDRAELSPFRELLTEFRNLTERYGQALLALGEARGEVASLRSRVDLLEARMELRLPLGSVTAGTGPWPSAPYATEPARPMPPLEHEPGAAEDEGPRGLLRGPRRATQTFAKARARADDPSEADLPQAGEVGHAPPDVEAVAAAEPTLPREVAPADAVPVADEAVEAPIVEAPSPDDGTAALAEAGVVAEPPIAEPHQTTPVADAAE